MFDVEGSTAGKVVEYFKDTVVVVTVYTGRDESESAQYFLTNNSRRNDHILSLRKYD